MWHHFKYDSFLFGKKAFFVLARKSRGCVEAYIAYRLAGGEGGLSRSWPAVPVPKPQGGKGPFPNGN